MFALTAGASMSPARGQGSLVLDPITVLATKTEEKTTESLAAVSSVSPEQISQLMPSRTSGVFYSVPGVWFQERADDPGTAINIRGLQDFGRVAVLIDGARQNFQRSGHNADGLFYLEPELLTQADVVRGPVANIYGSGAIGGVASLRTKDVDDVLRPGDTWGILTHGQAGSNHGKGLASAFAAVRANANVDFFVGGTLRKHYNFDDGRGNEVLNSQFDTKTGISKLTVRPADGHEVKFSGLTYESNFYNGTPNSTNTATVYKSSAKNHIASARWKYRRPEDRIFDTDVSVYWTKTDLKQLKVFGVNSAISGLLGSTRRFAVETVGTDVNNTSRFDTGPVRHALTYGGDWFRDRVEVTDPTGTGDLFTPNGERSVSGGFAQLKSNYSTWLETVAAIRYDAFNLSGAGTQTSGDRLSPKVTVGITPVPWFTVYGTYAEGYRAPAITEVFFAGAHPAGPFGSFFFLPNSSLQPEIGKSKEVGINIRQNDLWMPGDALRIKANVFRNDIEDFIEQVDVPAGTAGVAGVTCPIASLAPCIQYQNISNARIQGVEFEGNYDMGEYFYGLSATRLRGINRATGLNLLKIQPATIATTLGARYLDRKLTSVWRVKWVNAKKQGDIPSGTIPATGRYTLVDYYAGYQINEDMLAEFSIENMFDRFYARYLDTTTTNSAILPSPSPGITVKGGLKVRFGERFYGLSQQGNPGKGRS